MSAIAANSILARHPDMLAGLIDEQMVMVSIETGNYLNLSPVAGRIWEILEKPLDFEALCAILVNEYEIDPETCHAQVQAFLQEMLKHQAIVIH